MKRAFYIASIAGILLIMLVGHRRAVASGSENKTTTPSEITAGTPSEIKIDNFSFTPATLTVPAGTQVTWTNRDDIPHTVVSDDQSVKSKTLDTDEKFTFTFTKPGTYPYFCSIHPKMKGKIVVQ